MGFMSGESLVIVLLVGLIAGWLAGQIMRGAGFGIAGDIVIGIIGAFIGTWLLPRLGVHLGAGLIAAIVNATIGALLLLVIIKLVREECRTFLRPRRVLVVSGSGRRSKCWPAPLALAFCLSRPPIKSIKPLFD